MLIECSFGSRGLTSAYRLTSAHPTMVGVLPSYQARSCFVVMQSVPRQRYGVRGTRKELTDIGSALLSLPVLEIIMLCIGTNISQYCSVCFPFGRSLSCLARPVLRCHEFFQKNSTKQAQRHEHVLRVRLACQVASCCVGRGGRRGEGLRIKFDQTRTRQKITYTSICIIIGDVGNDYPLFLC